MTLLSADEDFCYRTLAAVPGALPKLAYLARLRDGQGKYHHWGMNRMYGENAAADAIAQAHTQAWLEVLRTPIPKLLAQLAEMNPATRQAVIAELKDYRRRCHPSELGGGAVRHFNSVLLALEHLSRLLDATPRVS